MSTQMILLECKQLLRSRWIQIVTVLFAIIFTAILMIQHLALPDTNGFTRQTASLLNILLFLHTFLSHLNNSLAMMHIY